MNWLIGSAIFSLIGAGIGLFIFYRRYELLGEDFMPKFYACVFISLVLEVIGFALWSNDQPVLAGFFIFPPIAIMGACVTLIHLINSQEDPPKIEEKKPEPPKKEEPPPPDYSIPVETRCSHQLIIGGSGSGKTTLILEQIAEDLQSACSLVVFDSEGDIYPKLLKVEHPSVVLIDPEDEQPVTLSLFPNDLDRATELITFALDSLNNPLTPPMRNMLRFVIRLCLLTPNPNLHTLREVFTDPSRFPIDELPETAKAFFREEWKNQKETRDRLTQRIFPLADQDAFARMFGGTQTLNLREKLDEGSLILINSKIGSVFFTRFMVYLVYQVIQERDPNRDNMPVYLYLDESKSVMDENIVTILEKARKRRLGLVLAFQSVPNEHQDSLLANTAIKAVALGVTPKDARLLADSVGRSADALTYKRPHTFYFHVAGLHNRNRVTDQTALQKLPRRGSVNELMAENRRKYSRVGERKSAIPGDDIEALNRA